MELGNHRLDEDRHLLRVETAGQVVESYFYDILTDFFRIVCIVGKGLNICDEDKHSVIISLILEFHTAAEGTHVMAEMQLAGRTVAC